MNASSRRLRELHAAPVPIELEELGFFDRAGIFFAGVALTPELAGAPEKSHSIHRPVRVHS